MWGGRGQWQWWWSCGRLRWSCGRQRRWSENSHAEGPTRVPGRRGKGRMEKEEEKKKGWGLWWWWSSSSSCLLRYGWEGSKKRPTTPMTAYRRRTSSRTTVQWDDTNSDPASHTWRTSIREGYPSHTIVNDSILRDVPRRFFSPGEVLYAAFPMRCPPPSHDTHTSQWHTVLDVVPRRSRTHRRVGRMEEASGGGGPGKGGAGWKRTGRYPSGDGAHDWTDTHPPEEDSATDRPHLPHPLSSLSSWYSHNEDYCYCCYYLR